MGKCRKIIDCVLKFFAGIFFWFPGMPAIFASDLKGFAKTVGEFSLTVIFSIMPLLVIYTVEVLRSDPKTISLLIVSKYVEAGQIFFYVGPIIGAIFYLVLTDMRKNSESERDTDTIERLWFVLYIVICPAVSVLILVMHHFDVLSTNISVIRTSFLIYLISLYFSFINILYSNISSNYGTRSNNDQDEVIGELDDFTGEHNNA